MFKAKGTMGGKKSLLNAYVLWLLGGIYGLHHFYLERDFQAFVWWTTLGGFGGWIADVFNMPRYVRDANEDPKHMLELVKKMRQNKKVSTAYLIHVTCCLFILFLVKHIHPFFEDQF